MPNLHDMRTVMQRYDIFVLASEVRLLILFSIMTQMFVHH